MLKSDEWLEKLAAQGGISEFPETKVHITESGLPVLSYGPSSYGYDLRLADTEVFIFRYSRLDLARQVAGEVLDFLGLSGLAGRVKPPAADPKNFDNKLTRYLKKLEPIQDETGHFVIVPPQTCWLGVAHEITDIPSEVLVLCTGKSTIARTGGILFPTPGEPGWRGRFTLEGYNTLRMPVKLYLMEGIVQLIYMGGEPCKNDYSASGGKYQDQSLDEPRVALPKVFDADR